MWVVVYNGRTVYGPTTHADAAGFAADPENLDLIERMEVGL